MRWTTFAFCIAGLPVFAVGSEDEEAPAPSETTTVCEDGMIWDLATQSCLPPEQSTNDDEARLNDIRELAYDGQYATALTMLETLKDPESPLALTYFGYVNRKRGDVAVGMAYYRQAIARAPENHLARSYMGMAFLEQGNFDSAHEQLIEIQVRGGKGSWPEQALLRAMADGSVSSY